MKALPRIGSNEMNARYSRKSSSLQVRLALLIVTAADWSSSAVETNAAPLKYEEPRFITARIYGVSANSTNLLYNFSRRATRSGEALHVLREYSYPDGHVAARERLVYLGDNLVSYELEELQIGARGQATIRRDDHHPAKSRIVFEYSNGESAARAKTSNETLQPETLVNDMIGPFLMSHYDTLLRGGEVRCRYLVIPRLETVGFKFKKDSESTWEGRPVIIVRMEAISPIIRALIDPVFFKVKKDAPHRVLEYVGRTTPKIKVGNKWKDLDAATVFDWK